MFVGLYYPAMTTAAEQCYGGDTYGTGTVSCTDTLSCLAACPPTDAGAGFNSSDGQEAVLNIEPCVQQCFAQACPNASAPLVPLLNCIQSSCSAQCAAPGSTCSGCVAASCATQYEACSTATCGTVPAP
jgi:hypothetical protein